MGVNKNVGLQNNKILLYLNIKPLDHVRTKRWYH